MPAKADLQLPQEPLPWERNENLKALAKESGDLPFGIYLLGASIIAIAAVSHFAHIQLPDSCFHTDFISRSIPDDGIRRLFLWVHCVGRGGTFLQCDIDYVCQSEWVEGPSWPDRGNYKYGDYSFL